MARGFHLHQYLCVATNWKKANQGFTWFYHCQVYGTTHATAFHGEVVQKCTKLIKNLPTMGCSMGISQYPSFSQCYWTMSEATVVQLHLQQPSGSTKLDDLRKKQIRSVASIHPFQTNTNYLTRIYNRTIPYLGRIPTESRHHHCS